MSLEGSVAAAWLAALAGLHLCWAAGGTWGLHLVVPERVGGARLFHPGPLACAGVAAALLGAAAIAVAPLRPLHLLVAAVFLVRAVGDFRYVGFFKRVHHSRFARYDTRLFSPLCLLIAALMAR